MSFKFVIYFIIALILLGPLWVLISGQVNLHLEWQTANRDSARIAPNPETTKEAVIQAYAARAFSWRGVFATHTWIAIKPKNAAHYKVYQVVGWRVYRNLPALMSEQDIPDRNWYAQKPTVILDIRGDKAEKLIPEIIKAAEVYPYPKSYILWPGPNSNTFTAFVARHVPGLEFALPSTAIGKDYLGENVFFARAPSGTGYQFSLSGIFGILIAKQEGIEINILGAVFGVNPKRLAIIIPGVGEIGPTIKSGY